MSDYYSEEERTIIISYRLGINRALWGEVIPSLRRVVMKWPPVDNCIQVIFYHDGPITEAIKDHYLFISSEVECPELKEEMGLNFEIIRIDAPQRTPQPKRGEGFTIYSRKEPFEDPTDGP